MSERPLMVDLYCGLGGWAEGGLSEGYDVIGFDIERHEYGDHRYPGQLVIQDVRTLHGSQFKKAALIVASPPCQAYSYRAMPWKRAKALPPPDNTLFETCFRIQREACEAAGRHIPLIVENVRGAQKWVGQARWNFGSFYLWGDIPALMPPTLKGVKGKPYETGKGQNPDGRKGVGPKWDSSTKSGAHGMKCWTNPAEGIKHRDLDGYERDHPHPFGWKAPRTSSSNKSVRKAASAMIAKIPLPLSRHIAATFSLASGSQTTRQLTGRSPIELDAPGLSLPQSLSPETVVPGGTAPLHPKVPPAPHESGATFLSNEAR